MRDEGDEQNNFSGEKNKYEKCLKRNPKKVGTQLSTRG
jgi:hypothetical protein